MIRRELRSFPSSVLQKGFEISIFVPAISNQPLGRIHPWKIPDQLIKVQINQERRIVTKRNLASTNLLACELANLRFAGASQFPSIVNGRSIFNGRSHHW